MAKYLYGASVQGIQGFIFQTNKLVEIIGASELVERICTTFFKEKACVNEFNVNSNWIQGAAGNIKYLFEDSDMCKKIFRIFPKAVMELAPGITISQAVVKIEGLLNQGHFDLLEEKLRAERNQIVSPIDLGFISTERSRRTGVPAIETSERTAYADASSLAKLEAAKQSIVLSKIKGSVDDKYFPKKFSELTNDGKRWLAIIHADGNGLGTVIQGLVDSLKDSNDEVKLKESFKEFSKNLESATIEAASTAFLSVFKDEINSKKIIPFRPIILGGDDLTIICPASKAILFTKLFLEKFEEQTKEKLGSLFSSNKISLENLTACAGIAFTKENFPFHYSYRMAELLCSEAKRVSKTINSIKVPSSLLFHKVQSSFVDADRYKDIEEAELKLPGSLSFKCGPYFLDDNGNGYLTIDSLLAKVELLNIEGSPKSRFRKWVSEMYISPESAKLEMDRIVQIHNDKNKSSFITEFSLEQNDNKKLIIHDALLLASLTE